MRNTNVAQAYSVLGLEEGSSLETVKTTYKQAALRTHPDKNPDNPDATAEFQRIGEAYRVLVKHLDKSSTRSHPHYHGSDDEDEDEDEYYYDDSDDDGLDFYMFLFQRFMNSRAFYYGPPRRNAHYNHARHEEVQETPQQYQDRLRRQREEQQAAQERRKAEAIARKERAAREREQERLDAEKRQKDKVQAKKAKAEADRKSSEDRARALKQKSQENRSSVFAAARRGDAKKVMKGIWEDAVDAAGGEVKPDCAEYVKCPPKDLKETLLHIATAGGDLELVKWLDSHSKLLSSTGRCIYSSALGADMEERNSQGLTAFHLAVKKGKTPIISYIVDAYPPHASDSRAIYDCSDCTNLLALALESREPEAVWLILENKLASTQDITKAWSWASSDRGVKVLQGAASPKDKEKAEDILQLLKRSGGFSSPPTSSGHEAKSTARSETTQPQSPTLVPAQVPRSTNTPPPSVKQNNARGRGRGRGRGRARGAHHGPPAH